MRLPRIALLLGFILAGTLMSTPTASAGGWATTYLDPLPQRIEPGRTYVVGYWVLQHGSHPFEGNLGDTALRLDNGPGEPMTFSGVALREPAHFAAAVAVPHDGSWRLSAVQGIFADYEIGTLTVPGALALNPPPEPMTMTDSHHHAWGPIHPPDTMRPSSSVASDPTPAAAVQDLSNPSSGQGSWVFPILALLGLSGAGLVLLLGRRKARSSR